MVVTIATFCHTRVNCQKLLMFAQHRTATNGFFHTGQLLMFVPLTRQLLMFVPHRTAANVFPHTGQLLIVPHRTAANIYITHKVHVHQRKAYKMRVVLHTLELEHCMGVVGFLADLEENRKRNPGRVLPVIWCPSGCLFSLCALTRTLTIVS